MDITMLRRGFKAVCQATDNRFQNFQVRIHRSMSWFERALELDEDKQPDGRLLYAWIALNSLFGSWDTESGYPARDRDSCGAFVNMLMGVDSTEMLVGQLTALEPEILQILDDKFLDPRFWKDPENPGNVHAKYQQAIRLYHDKNWSVILEYVLERIAVLRGQIVHGAATRGSKLNRDSLYRCRKVLESLLPVFLQLVIEHRADDDWAPLCYPPIRE